VQLTQLYAHEVAQLKARLLEKEAQLMGGFGNPAKLDENDWDDPPFTPVAINSATGSEHGPAGTHPFGFEAFLKSMGELDGPTRAPSQRSLAAGKLRRGLPALCMHICVAAAGIYR
jgi:hypothetical protein